MRRRVKKICGDFVGVLSPQEFNKKIMQVEEAVLDREALNLHLHIIIGLGRYIRCGYYHSEEIVDRG